MLIYAATNSINGKQYVGLTTQKLKNRVYGHVRDAKRHPNIKFYRAINKYGIDSFEFSVLEDDIQDTDILKSREMYWVNKLDTYYNGYNSTFGGEDAPMWHKEIRLKVANSQKGRVVSEATRIKLRKAFKNRKGTPHTEAHKIHMSLIMTGVKKSPEQVEKMRINSTGKKQSKETVEKRMKYVRGVKKSPEHTAKLAANFAKYGFRSSGSDHPRSFPIYQLDKDSMEILMRFDTITEATKYLNNTSAGGGISMCVNNKRKSAYGYKWIKAPETI